MLKQLKKRLLKRSCREVSRLISDMQERRLGWFDRMLLRTHLGICDNCVQYTQQVKFMRRAMGRWRNYGDDL
jgi:hypothetical protein